MHEHIRVWFENILNFIEKKDEAKALEYLERNLSFMLDESQRMDGFSLHMDRMLEEELVCKVVKANKMPESNIHTQKDLLLSFRELRKTGNSLLHSAAQYGMTGLCDFLIKKGINVNTINSNQETPLMLAMHYAAASGDQTCAGFLLEQGANPNNVSINGWCALSIAFYNSDASNILRLMSFLLENNARDGVVADPHVEPNTITGKLQPIVFAIIRNKKLADEHELMQKAIKGFLYYGGRGVIRPGDEIKMMRIFASTGNMQGLGLLAEYEYDIHKMIDDDRRTALHIGAYFGKLDFVRWLLDINLDCSLPDRGGQTPARLAFSRNQRECGRLLMAYAFLEKHMLRTYQKQLNGKGEDKSSFFGAKSQKPLLPCLPYGKLLQVILFKDLADLQSRGEVNFFRGDLKKFIWILEQLSIIEMQQLKESKEKGSSSSSSIFGGFFSSVSKNKVGAKDEVFKISDLLSLARRLELELAKSRYQTMGSKVQASGDSKPFFASVFSFSKSRKSTKTKEMALV